MKFRVKTNNCLDLGIVEVNTLEELQKYIEENLWTETAIIDFSYGYIIANDRLYKDKCWNCKHKLGEYCEIERKFLEDIENVRTCNCKIER